MLLLIDAYNLLHQSDQMQRGRADGWLARARERLVDSLAQHLGVELSCQTCLVFDSRAAPRGLPATLVRQSIELRFAVDHAEADDLLEELISRHPTPKRLMVVSSDHRIHKAASRRGAKCIDSDLWYADLVERGPRLAIAWPPPTRPHDVANDAESLANEAEKPAAPSDPAELAAWLKEFDLDESQWNDAEAKASDSRWSLLGEAKPVEAAAPEKPQSPKGAGKSKRFQKEQDKSSRSGGGSEANARRRVKRKNGGSLDGVESREKPDPDHCIDLDLANPFPEGYGEDLLD